MDGRTAAGVGQWQAFLAGKMLKRASSHYRGSKDGAFVGSSSSRTLHLCSDGEVTEHTLQVQGAHTYVDGERFNRMPSDRCQ
ncbi:MAG: hypothetical protein ACSLE2_17765 [Lysobacterales bacterium]